MTLAPVVTSVLTASAGESAERVSHVVTQHLVAPPEHILPLLTPLGERAWAAGWEPEMRC
ncbi:MAG TPA: hypothetical protein VLQ79_04020 [Myxococcaceae bacterium]|nr:hypothetical protein [Myxococcaceae bacterium]